MRLSPRLLYTKIFLWFCVTVAVTVAVFVLLAGVLGQQPFGRRWMGMTQDLYAHTAVDFYSNGGAPALAHYLDSIARGSGIEGHLVDEGGRDVLGQAFPAHTLGVYEQATRTGLSAARLGRHWVAASVVRSATGQRYIFVMEAHPTQGFVDGTFLFGLAPRLGVGLVFVAVFCLLLARHITRPVRVLQAAATRMAAGELSVRTQPALAGRVDELAMLAAAFDGMAERIESLLVAEQQTLAEISHELRSPLTRLGVSLELLRRGEMDVIEPMQQDLDRLNTMIGSVLDLARLDLQPKPALRSAVDLLAVAEEVVAGANLEGRPEGKSVELDGGPERCMVVGESALLHSCLENLVRNALQHSPTGGTVVVQLSTEAGMVRAEVMDDGPGVSEEALPLLFAPFFRGPGSRSAHPGGTGLGLTIAERIARRHGGTLAALNRRPQGLCVRLELPSA